MAARQRNFRIVAATDLAAEGARAIRRNNMIVERKDVEDRGRDRFQVNPAARQLEGAVDQAVVLVKLLQPLLGGLAGMMRSVGEPLLHAKEVHELVFVSDDIGVIIENTELMNSPGNTPYVSTSLSISAGSRLRVHKLMKP